jgi:anti-anti-sigma factor
MLLKSTHVNADMHNGVLVATITCEKLDNYETGIIKGDLLPLATGIGKVALDLREVRTLCPVALGLLTELLKACHAKGGGLVVFNVNKEMQKLLAMTTLGKAVGICKNAEQAIKAVA